MRVRECEDARKERENAGDVASEAGQENEGAKEIVIMNKVVVTP